MRGKPIHTGLHLGYAHAAPPGLFLDSLLDLRFQSDLKIVKRTTDEFDRAFERPSVTTVHLMAGDTLKD